MPDNNISTDITAIDWLRIKAGEATNPSTRKHLRQAIDSFADYIGVCPIKLTDINHIMICDWTAYMFSHGYKLSSIATYLSKISALYGKAAKEGLVERSDCFSLVSSKLKDIPLSYLEILSDKDIFDNLRIMVQKDYSGFPALILAKDIILFSIYNGGLSFEQIALFKKSDYSGTNPAVIEIVNRYKRPRNKYLFPLHQSERTPGQLIQSLSRLFKEGLASVGINLSEISDSTPLDLWAIAAKRAGFSERVIAGCTQERKMLNPTFSFIRAEKADSSRLDEICRRVIDVLTKDHFDWYAMQFRPHVNIDMIDSRMKSCSVQFISRFYPTAEIVKRVGKKKIRKNRPLVNGLLFFKMKASQLDILFRHIGDLAWGYRATCSASRSYATISQTDMDLFQATINRFDDSIDIYPAGTIDLQPGDRLEIIGGSLQGHLATFDSDSQFSGRTIYRLKLIGDNDIEWIINTDMRLVRKMPDGSEHISCCQ